MKNYAMGDSASGKAVISYTRSETGTKRKATIAGYDSIGYISTINNMYICTHTKIDNKWIKN